MSKSVEQMTIAELQRAIRLKRSLAKKAPKLRQERKKLLARLKEIEEQLATLGPVRAARKAKPKRKAAKKRVAKKRAQKKVAAKRRTRKVKKTAAGKRQRGVTDTVIAVIGARPMRTDAVLAALKARGIVAKKKTLTVTLSKLAKEGKIGRADRGLYCKAAKAAKKAPKKVAKKSAKKVARKAAKKAAAAKRKPAAKAKKRKKTATQQILDVLAASSGPMKAGEIRKALPAIKPGYMSNTLNRLKKGGRVKHADGKWSV